MVAQLPIIPVLRPAEFRLDTHRLHTHSENTDLCALVQTSKTYLQVEPINLIHGFDLGVSVSSWRHHVRRLIGPAVQTLAGRAYFETPTAVSTGPPLVMWKNDCASTLFMYSWIQVCPGIWTADRTNASPLALSLGFPISRTLLSSIDVYDALSWTNAIYV